jgi:PIN domain nuclease of toxin-antitoxin system
MAYLLDTHVLIWFRADPTQLGEKTLSLIREPTTHCMLSSVSALELAQLSFKGRLTLPMPVDKWFEDSLRRFRFKKFDMDHRIAVAAYHLPGNFHPDPADRLLVATARLEGVTLLTADRRILEYPSAKTFDARL